jgi:hypothetical protein
VIGAANGQINPVQTGIIKMLAQKSGSNTLFSHTGTFHAKQLVRHLYEARTSGDAWRTAMAGQFVQHFSNFRGVSVRSIGCGGERLACAKKNGEVIPIVR